MFGIWQVRHVDVEEKGTNLCGTPFCVANLLPAMFAISGGKCEAMITNHLHDHVDHVSIRWQLPQLAGEAAMP